MELTQNKDTATDQSCYTWTGLFLTSAVEVLLSSLLLTG